MARISTYNIDQNVTAQDKFIGTDSSGGVTKNFTFEGITNFLNNTSAIAIAGQNNFFFQTDLSHGRNPGTISFSSGGGVNTAFNSLTTIRFSRFASSGNNVLDYLQTLVDKNVILAQVDDVNNFGVYKLLSLDPAEFEPDFYDATFEIQENHGALLFDKFYAFAVYSGAAADVPTLQSVTDTGNTTSNNILVQNPGYISTVSPGDIITQEISTGKYSFLSADGIIGMNNGSTESKFKNTDVTNPNVVLEFPDKPTGSYTIATTADVPATPSLQDVTNVGNTTNDQIRVENTHYLSLVELGDVGASNKDTGSYAYVGADGILGVNNGSVESRIRNTDVDSNNVVLEFPNKTPNSYTIATTDDINSGTVTSVGLTMPSAFTVTNSPITSSGDIAVTGAGLASQYVRGDGSLASFPDVAGGGGGQVFYFNGGTSQGTIGGNAFKQLSAAAVLGTGVDFTSTSVDDVVFANFITDVGKPTQEVVPAGVWVFQCYLSASSTSTCEVYVTVEVYDGSTFTVLATSLHERLTNSSTIDLYTFTCAVPEYNPLTPADRIVIRFYGTNLSGSKTVTLHTQDSHVSSVQTTFTTGLASLDGLTAAAQYLQVGTTGTDFNINTSGTDTHTFNLPTASAANRGALSSSDWSEFNGKQASLGFTPVTNARTISTTSPLTGGGDLSANRTLSMPMASSGQSGYLDSNDWTFFGDKQETLVSGANLATINGNDLLAGGNIVISVGTTIIPYNAYLNTVSGNNATAVLGDSTKPYLTMAALITALPATIDFPWTINITGATTAITMPSMPPRDLIFNADVRYTYDFNFNTGTGYIITGAVRNFVYNFLNGNINLKSDNVAGRSLGTGSQLTSLLTITGWVNIIDWSNDGVSSVGVILLNSDLLVNELVKRSTAFSVFIGNPISLRFKKITFTAFHGNGVLRSSSTYPTVPVIIDLISSTTPATDVELTAAQTPINFYVELRAVQILGIFKVSYPPTKLILNDLTCTGVTSLNLDALITTGRVITDIPIIPQKINSRTLQNLEGRITGSNNNWGSTLTIDNCRLSVTDFITKNAVGVSAKVVSFKGNNIIKQLSTTTPIIFSLTSASPTVVDIEGSLNITNGAALADQYATINYVALAVPSFIGTTSALQSLNFLT